MKKEDYINLLLVGYIDNKKFYRSHLLRLIKQAKENHLIGNYEFLVRSLDIIDECISETNNKTKQLLYEIEPKILDFEKKESFSKEEEVYYNNLKKMTKSEPEYYLNTHRPFVSENKKVTLTELIDIKESLKMLFNEIQGIIENKDLKNYQILDLITYNNAVFKNELAYQLFGFYVNDFKGDKSEQAIFSFLFDAMTRLQLVHCNATMFLEELSKYDIVLDRIDTKQCYSKSNNKTPTFKYMYKDVFGEFPSLKN